MRSQFSTLFQNFLRHVEIFFPFLKYFPTGAKNIAPWASLSSSNSKIWGISFTLLYGRFWDVWWDDLVNYFVSFLLFFHYWKLKRSLQRGVTQKCKLFKLFATSTFFNIRHYGKIESSSKQLLDLFKRSIKLKVLNIFPVFTCIDPHFTENQSIKLFYFGVFSCCCEI